MSFPAKIITYTAQPGDSEFERSGKNSVQVGDHTTVNGKHYVVANVGKSYYHSADACEDMDCFCRDYGWRTSYTAREITPEQLAAETQKTAEDKERKALESAIRGSFSIATHLPLGRPDAIQLTDIWSKNRMAGSEHWYLGSDGIVYHMRSDYNWEPNWWSTTATVQMIERAKTLGMKVIS